MEETQVNETQLETQVENETETQVENETTTEVENETETTVFEVPMMEGEEVKQEDKKFAVVYFVRYTEGHERPSSDEIKDFFSGFGEVSHIKLTKTPNLAFVFMKTLITSQNKDRARTVMQEIQKAGRGHFTIDVARSPRRFQSFNRQSSTTNQSFQRRNNQQNYVNRFPIRQPQPIIFTSNTPPQVQYRRTGEVFQPNGQPYRHQFRPFRPQQGSFQPSRNQARQMYQFQEQERVSRRPPIHRSNM